MDTMDAKDTMDTKDTRDTMDTMDTMDAMDTRLCALVSRPWSGRLAHSDKTAHDTVLVIHADRTRPISPAARAVRTAAVEWASRPLRQDGS